MALGILVVFLGVFAPFLVMATIEQRRITTLEQQLEDHPKNSKGNA
jgi:hypothetical protein